MSTLMDQYRLLGTFLKSGFIKIFLWCAAGLTVSVGLGFWAAQRSPELVEQMLRAFMEMVDEAGVMDSAGNISPFGLLANNWKAMLVTVLYGFAPFLFLPVVSLSSNGILMGVLAGWSMEQGLGVDVYLAGILPHGIFELSALILSAACGVKLCLNMGRMIFNAPDRIPLTELLADLLRVLLLLVAPLTMVAAFVEAYVTPMIMGLFL